MATTFYLHAAASSNQSAKLPTTEQSTLTAYANFQAQSNNKSMNTTKGSSQAALTNTTFDTNSPANYFIGKWVSDLCINQSSISAQTWTWAFACKTNGDSGDLFPVDQNSTINVYVCLYVWRPSTGAVVGKILDGITGDNQYAPASNSSTNEFSEHDTFLGSAVSGIQANDVLVFEAWAGDVYTDGSATAWNFYYDGTDTASLASTGGNPSSAASYISSTQTIALTAYAGGVLHQPSIPTESVLFGTPPESIKRKPVGRKLTTEAVGLATDPVTKKVTKKVTERLKSPIVIQA
jgi:hypothetical protein